MSSQAKASAAAPEIRIDLEIKPDFLEVRRALQTLRAKLAPGLDDDPMTTMEIVGAEILNNVVEHGFAGVTDRPGRIEISASLVNQRLTLRIVDDGHPMPGGTTPNAKSPEIDRTNPSALPEGGFGWALIHTLSGELSYAYEDGKNLLSVRIDV